MNKPIECSVCGFGVICAKGGNLVKVGDNEYRHANPSLCIQIKRARAIEDRKRAKASELVTAKPRLIILR